MGAETLAGEALTFRPVTPDLWADLEILFGEHGACGGCWCMWWRMKRAEFDRSDGEERKRAFRKIVDSGAVPGILAYMNGGPIAWCSIAPRREFPVLDRSPVLKRVDESPVWSLVCFFVAKPYRQKGLSRLLIQGAVDYARRSGARIVESYPVDKGHVKNTSTDGFTGFAGTFLKMGFKEVARRSEKRPVLRIDC